MAHGPLVIAVAIDKTSVHVAIHYSMKKIYQSCDLGHTMGQSNVSVSK